MKLSRVRIITLLLALCITAGLLPALNTPAKAASVWDTATPLPMGTPTAVTFTSTNQHYYKFEVTKGNCILTVNTDHEQDYLYVYNAKHNSLGNSSDRKTLTVALADAGTYYLGIRPKANVSADTVTLTLSDNDRYEANNSKETATTLTSGASADFILCKNDSDWFAIRTTKDAQDIQIEIGGFTYANQGEFYLYYDLSDNRVTINQNSVLHYHAAKAGIHYIRLEHYWNRVLPLTLTLTATVLDGDQNEANDTKGTSTTLPMGTDKKFVLGGYGDEDWFQFEVSPAASGNNLYTLQFLDLNPDYSDTLYYEVFAPDGSVLTPSTKVNIHHTNILACEQQGVYSVRVTTNEVQPSRSTLRIRISEGGSDPYESNDTWLTAASIQADQLVQHVLASTSDEDWFYFTAPEADMSFVMDPDKYCSVSIYRAADLAETGYQSNNYYYQFGSQTVGCCKLDDAGVYYLRLTTDASHVSEELRSFTLSLGSAGSEERNDTWDQATPLYEGAPQSFDLPGSNDSDWFKLVVPDGASSITFYPNHSGNTVGLQMYREKDIINAGLNAAAVYSRDGISSSFGTSVSPGTYYIKLAGRYWYDHDERAMDCSLRYNLTYIEGEQPVDPVPLNSAPDQMELGTSLYLHHSPSSPHATVTMTWISSDPSVLYVGSNGRVVAVGVGTATISVEIEIRESDGNESWYTQKTDGSKTITVTPTAPTESSITSVQLDKYSLTMYIGEGSQTLSASVLPAEIGASVQWTSSNTAAATVDQNGIVTAVAPGISIITAAAGDHNASCIVTVQAARVRVTGISFADPSLQIPLAGKSQLVATIAPSNATVKTLTWVSDDNSVATVSRTGIVQALAVGVTTVRATTLDGGFSAEITIEVTAAPQPGDVNGDGYIDSADAMLCLRSIVGLIKLNEAQVKAADVNGDGSVDAGDAVRILRYDAKLINSLT